MTILGACTEALGKAGTPLSADEMYDEIVKAGLYEFKAKDPRSMVRAALRKHLRASGPHRVRQLDNGRFELIST